MKHRGSTFWLFLARIERVKKGNRREEGANYDKIDNKASRRTKHLSWHHTSVNTVSSHFLSPFLTLITANFSVTLPDPWIRKQQKKRRGESLVSHENNERWTTILRWLVSQKGVIRNDTIMSMREKRAGTERSLAYYNIVIIVIM